MQGTFRFARLLSSMAALLLLLALGGRGGAGRGGAGRGEKSKGWGIRVSCSSASLLSYWAFPLEGKRETNAQAKASEHTNRNEGLSTSTPGSPGFFVACH